MRKVCQIIAAGGLIAGLAASASASPITFVTPGTAMIAGSGPVDASATFTNNGDGTLSITLDNLQTNIKDAGQLLSDLFFTVVDPTQTTQTLTSGSLISSSAPKVTVAGDGTVAPDGSGPTGWQLYHGDKLPGMFHLNDIKCITSGCAGPAQTIIGPPDASGKYSNANSSIAGSGPHNPFLSEGAMFTIEIAGLTPSDTITAATFSFGTTPGLNVEGLELCPDCGTTTTSVVPEPASMLLLGSGLIGAGLRRRRTRRIAA